MDLDLGWKFPWFFGDIYRTFWVAMEEINHKCVQLWITSTIFFPDILVNKKLTFTQLLTSSVETSENKVSAIKHKADLN